MCNACHIFTEFLLYSRSCHIHDLTSFWTLEYSNTYSKSSFLNVVVKSIKDIFKKTNIYTMPRCLFCCFYSVVSNFLRSHGLQHARPPCPSLSPEFDQTPVHWVSDAIQPSHPLSSPSPALSLSQHQGLFQWVGSSHYVHPSWKLACWAHTV